MAVESAPDEPRWRAKRGQFLRRRDYKRAAMRDLARAVDLAPDEPYFYEERAKAKVAIWDDDWWNLDGAVGDCAHAIRLRIERGQIAGDPAYLAAQADQSKPLWGNDGARVRALAFLALAIAGDPNQPERYLARARLLELSLPYYRLPSSGALRAAREDRLRALALDPSHEVARLGIVEALRQSLERASAHERLERLLQARQKMRDFGLTPELINAIAREVEAA